MRVLKFIVGILLLVLLVVVLAGPLGPVPGVMIGGEATPVPERWGDTQSVDEILLEVSGGLVPYVVVIWVVDVAGELYVVGSSDSGWTGMLGNGGPVRMRIENRTYSLHATRIESGIEPIFTAYVEKYQPNYPDIVADFPSPEAAAAGSAVFRLHNR